MLPLEWWVQRWFSFPRQGPMGAENTDAQELSRMKAEGLQQPSLLPETDRGMPRFTALCFTASQTLQFFFFFKKLMG